MNGDDWQKRKKFDFFFDLEDFQGMIDDLMKDLFEADFDSRARNPLVMGFNIKMGGDGKPLIEQFGNIRAKEGKPVVSDIREPLVDVIESEKDITITAELPGVEKKDIKFRLPDKGTAVIEVGGERSFYKEIKLPKVVKQKGANAKFKNGVLEVRFEKENPSRSAKEKDELKIE